MGKVVDGWDDGWAGGMFRLGSRALRGFVSNIMLLLIEYRPMSRSSVPYSYRSVPVNREDSYRSGTAVDHPKHLRLRC